MAKQSVGGKYIYIGRYHRMFRDGRHLQTSSSPTLLPEQDHNLVQLCMKGTAWDVRQVSLLGCFVADPESLQFWGFTQNLEEKDLLCKCKHSQVPPNEADFNS